MAPRSIWNGTIAFAGVFVAVKVHSATEDRTVHFHEVHTQRVLSWPGVCREPQGRTAA